MRKEHDRIFSQLQVALLRSQSDKLSKIEEAEKPYYYQDKHTPNKDNHSTEYGQLMKDYHYICKLLRKLKVELWTSFYYTKSLTTHVYITYQCVQSVTKKSIPLTV